MTEDEVTRLQDLLVATEKKLDDEIATVEDKIDNSETPDAEDEANQEKLSEVRDAVVNLIEALNNL